MRTGRSVGGALILYDRPGSPSIARRMWACVRINESQRQHSAQATADRLTWMSSAVMLLRKPLGAGAHRTGSACSGRLSGYVLGIARLLLLPAADESGSPSVSVSV